MDFYQAQGCEPGSLGCTDIGTDSRDTVRDQFQFTSFIPGFGWFGVLTDLHEAHMYQILLSEAVPQVTFVGSPWPSQQYTINNGWTWIPYVAEAQPVGTGMPVGVAWSDGDQVKSHTAFAIYYGGSANLWHGTLVQLSPGVGYLVKTASESGQVSGRVSPTSCVAPPSAPPVPPPSPWQVNPAAYSDTMTVSALVVLDGVPWQSAEGHLIARVEGDVRGVGGALAVPSAVGGSASYTFDLVVHAVDGEGIRFHFSRGDGTAEVALDRTLTFQANAIVGRADNPLQISSAAVPPIPPPPSPIPPPPSSSPTPPPPSPAPSTRPCAFWCKFHPLTWGTMCGFANCNGCDVCGPNKGCAPFCARHPKAWTDKCGWEACDGCAVCGYGRGCKPWCEAHPKPWDVKCGFKACDGCPACAQD